MADYFDDPDTQFQIRSGYNVISAGNIYLNNFATNTESSFDISSVNNNALKLQKVFNINSKFLTHKLYNLNELLSLLKTTDTNVNFDVTELDAQGKKLHNFEKYLFFCIDIVSKK